MKKIKDKRKTVSIVLNALILLFEAIGFAMGISAEMFVYYTNLSNLIAAAVTLLFLACLLFGFKGKFLKIVSWLKYVAACMTTVTFAVVACILVPMQGVKMLYMGNFYCFHMICPILMLISFVFFEQTDLDKKKAYIGIVPTLIYAAVAVVCNCIGILDGPYPFLRVTKQPIYMSLIWCVVVLGIAWLIAYLLMKFHQKNLKPISEKQQKTDGI